MGWLKGIVRIDEMLDLFFEVVLEFGKHLQSA
jgi:hypothetical protein